MASKQKAPTPDRRTVDEAMREHRAGRLREADGLYGKALTSVPPQVDLLHMAGYCKLQLADYEGAARLLRQAIGLGKPAADLWNTLAEACRLDGRLEEALAAFDQALALDTTRAATHSNRGLVLRDLARLDEALASYDQAIALKPDYAIAHCNRGMVMRSLEQPLEAMASSQRALALDPRLAEAHLTLGNALADLKRPADALASYTQALVLKPGNAAAHAARGRSLIELNRLEEANDCFERAVALDPDDKAACTDLGTVRRNLYQTEAALEAFDRALALDPDFATALNNRAVALVDLKRPQEALAAHRRAIEIEPDFADAHWNEGLTHLLLGNLEAGWEKFEWRKRQKDAPLAQRRYAQPEWLGDFDIADKTILVYWEQGLGDTLQFCRYAPRLLELGAVAVVLLVQPALKRLLASLPAGIRVITEDDALPPFDAHCAMMSLPYALRSHLPSIPAATPYLAPAPEDVAAWRERLGEPGCPRVGLVWSGDPRKHQGNANRVDRVRSMPFQSMAGLLDVPGIEFFSLQKGDDATRQLHAHPRRERIVDWSSSLNDFADTAALVAHLDLVVSVDTSIVHLAGALGKPVWVLNRFNTCWRWLLDREDSPWYPSARIFRQSRLGEWGAVVDAVARELAGDTFLSRR